MWKIISRDEDGLVVPLFAVLPLLVVVGAVLADGFLGEAGGLLHASLLAIFFVVPEILLELLKLVVVLFGLALVGQLSYFLLVVLLHLQQGVIELLLQLYLLLVEGRPNQLLLQLQLVVDIPFVLIDQAFLILYHDFELDYFLVLLGPFLQRFLQGVSARLQFLLGGEVELLQLLVLIVKLCEGLLEFVIFLDV